MTTIKDEVRDTAIARGWSDETILDCLLNAAEEDEVLAAKIRDVLSDIVDVEEQSK